MIQLKVTVLMTVYNGKDFVAEAIESILGQSFRDFEFLILDNKSTDGTVKIIEQYEDSRIKLICNEENMGQAAALNKGLLLAQGQYIARMDADDVSLPFRLEKQVAFMDANPGVGICGTWVQTMGYDAGHVRKYPTGRKNIKGYFLFCTVLAHPSVMLRKEMFQKYDLLKYDSSFSPAEDYDLWEKASHFMEIDNIPEILVLYRLPHRKNRDEKDIVKADFSDTVRTRALHRLMPQISYEEIFLHNNLCRGVFPGKKELNEWFFKIQSENKKQNIFEEPYFSRTLAQCLLEFYLLNFNLGLKGFMFFLSSSFRNNFSYLSYSNLSLVWNFAIKKGFK